MGKKRLLLGLNLLSVFFLSVVLYGVWKISFLGLAEINSNLPNVLGIIFALLSLGSVGLILLLCLAVKGITPIFFEK
ncbi:MAG: hypothetical protein IKN43_11610, partial [Selenomonadaceae bacterium]|nr:hypothetical protein [Selenomonadaceae bacterium]